MGNKAFTLVELIIAVGIIALLTTLGITSYNRAQNQARVSRAMGDLKEISTALTSLANHTGQIPQHYSTLSCVNNLETALNTPQAGLLSTDGNFPNWQGPYTTTDLLDPWGNVYQFDPDYTCYQNVRGCENIQEGKVVRVIYSMGEDGNGGYTSRDNVVRVMCDP